MPERVKNLNQDHLKLSDKHIAVLSGFREGILSYRLPVTPIETKNLGKLFKYGIVDVFSTQSQSITNHDLEMYFTDDFSKICLRKRNNMESLLSIGISHDAGGAIEIVGIAKGEILTPIPKNDFGFTTLGYIIQGVVYSYEYEMRQQINNTRTEIVEEM
jgi:hypothetical protein